MIISSVNRYDTYFGSVIARTSDSFCSGLCGPYNVPLTMKRYSLTKITCLTESRSLLDGVHYPSAVLVDCTSKSLVCLTQKRHGVRMP